MVKILSLEPFAIAMEDPVAQLVEQLPFKPWVEGSSPSRITLFQESLLTSPLRLISEGVFFYKATWCKYSLLAKPAF